MFLFSLKCTHFSPFSSINFCFFFVFCEKKNGYTPWNLCQNIHIFFLSETGLQLTAVELEGGEGLFFFYGLSLSFFLILFIFLQWGEGLCTPCKVGPGSDIVDFWSNYVHVHLYISRYVLIKHFQNHSMEIYFLF